MESRKLEELVLKDFKILTNSGQEVVATLIGIPVIIRVNDRPCFVVFTEGNTEEIISRSAPAEANAYLKGSSIRAPVVKSPYWDYVPVQFYRI